MRDIEEINKLPIEEQIEAKMEVICSFEYARDIPSIYLPETNSDRYFFISYSQRDFRKVYLDLFHLAQHDISFWYDRGNPGGKDWPFVVERNIAPFQCKGVIFYISENSLTSPSVDDEMKIIQDLGKPYIPITLPFEKDYIYKGESVKGKEYPVSEMIDILLKNGEIDKKKANKLHEYFSDKTLYLHLGMPDVSKAEKINLCIPDIPLLVGKYLPKITYEGDDFEDILYIETINDSSVEKITKLDFIELLTHLEMDADGLYCVIFGPSCLANCRRLRTVEIPEQLFILKIEMHAFANDEQFIGFKGIEKLQCVILDGAFYNCSSFKMDIDFLTDRVGSYTFYNCSSLPDFILPEGLKTIGEYAFYGCSKFRMVGIPETVTRIEEGAYQACSKLYGVLTGKKTTYIGSKAFSDCPSLMKVSLGSELSYIGDDIFSGCPLLEFNEKGNINYLGDEDDKNPYLLAYSVVSKDEKIPGLERCRLISNRAFEGCVFQKRKLEIPDGCVFIGDSAFYRCNLKEVYLPNSLVSMGTSVFNFCRSLTKVVWPNGLATIPKGTFSSCFALKDVEFAPNSALNVVEEEAFARCINLCEINLPDSIVSIKAEAFKNCQNLHNIKTPSQLEIIGKEAFSRCAIESIFIPKSTTDIEESAFKECSYLKEITYPAEKECWKVLNRILSSTQSFDRYKKSGYSIDISDSYDNIWANYASLEVVHCTDGDLRRDDVLDDCYSDTLKFDFEGEKVELEKIGYVRYQNRDFILVRPLNEELPEGAAYTLEVVKDNNNTNFITIFDEALLDKIFNKFAKDLEKKNKNSN